jgi:hypothetical protein
MNITTDINAYPRSECNTSDQIISNSVKTALTRFRNNHPVDPCCCQHGELFEHIENMGLLNLNMSFIQKGLSETDGEAWHYFNGLKKAYLELQPRIKSIKPIPILIGELIKTCIREYDILNQEIILDSHASNLAMLETAAYLLLHYSPIQGKEWLDAIYQE